jgi:HAD superfamily phosphoserine phosphatase-like hydrolase
LPRQEQDPVLTGSQIKGNSDFSAKDFLQSVLSREPSIAVFDCDGTLWDGDSGYDFMVWSIEKGLVSRNASDWIDSRYRLYRTGAVSELAMCGEMVQIYVGLQEVEMRKAAAAFFQSRFAARIFPEMRSLVASLKERGTDIWVVSSTNNWVIEEGVSTFGIPSQRVICARVEVIGDVVTSKLLDVPTGEGKAQSLVKAGVTAPGVVFGNSIHDAAMLKIAHQAYPVNPTPALREIAAKEGWRIFYPEGASQPQKSTLSGPLG